MAIKEPIWQYSIAMVYPHWPVWLVWIVDSILKCMPLGVRRVNALLRKHHHVQGKEFIQALTYDLHITTVVYGRHHIPKTGATVVFVNHPGGQDVLAILAAMFSVREDIVILANELVWIEHLADTIIPVHMSSVKRIDYRLLEEALSSEKLVIIFAAGLDSRYDEEGQLRDRRWRTTGLRYALTYKAHIIVAYIEDANSALFYRVARWREHLSWKKIKQFPWENLFQLRELLQKNRHVSVHVAPPVLLEGDYTDIHWLRKQTDRLYAICYSFTKK